ncbi:hypothetical protein M8818_006551 [Zalaria obscura]|uniref:Uncharacterized protein n=1 Tax=Zalaria obscura TaxID=2024903 RepID=A0ACC3S710_9PEZI
MWCLTVTTLEAKEPLSTRQLSEPWYSAHWRPGGAQSPVICREINTMSPNLTVTAQYAAWTIRGASPSFLPAHIVFPGTQKGLSSECWRLTAPFLRSTADRATICALYGSPQHCHRCPKWPYQSTTI